MPALKCEICHTDECVHAEYNHGKPCGYLCSECSDAIVQLGNSAKALLRVVLYLDGEDVN